MGRLSGNCPDSCHSECRMGLWPTEGDEKGIEWAVGRRMSVVWNGEGRLRSGCVETVSESGPEGAF